MFKQEELVTEVWCGIDSGEDVSGCGARERGDGCGAVVRAEAITVVLNEGVITVLGELNVLMCISKFCSRPLVSIGEQIIGVENPEIDDVTTGAGLEVGDGVGEAC